MQASGLGKVSQDKQRQAMTSIDTIVADRNERYWRHSQQEAPKPREMNTLNATREATATIRLDATGQHRRETWQERCGHESHEETHLATMIIVTGASIGAKQVQRMQQ